MDALCITFLKKRNLKDFKFVLSWSYDVLTCFSFLLIVLDEFGPWAQTCRDRIPKLRLIVVIFAICYFRLEAFPGGIQVKMGILKSGSKVLNGF